MLKIAKFRSLVAILITLACGWNIFGLVVQDTPDYPHYSRQPDSLSTFLNDIRTIVPRIPKTGVICYAGRSAAGLSPRMHYIWMVYALAPRIVVPWGNQVHEEGPGLKSVAPSLLWTGKFDDTKCSFLLVHKLDSDAPEFTAAGFGQALELRSGSVDMILYTRQNP